MRRAWGRFVHGLIVVRTFAAIGVLNFTQYRSDFFLATVNALITLGTQIVGLVVIFSQTDDLGGWGPYELLLLTGVFLIISGLVDIVVQPSMTQLMEGIRLGTFDFMLTKPADSQLLASTQSVQPQQLINVAIGTVAVIVAAVLSGDQVTAIGLASFAVMLLAGVVLIYCFLFGLCTLAFWFVKLDNVLAIFQSIFGEAGRWPVTIFPVPVRLILTFVVPVAFAVTVPVEALTGRLHPLTAVGAAALAVVFLVLTRLFWRLALRHYTGASA